MTYRLSQETLREIGTKIKKERKRQKKRALDVAVEAGIEPSYYSKIENGGAKVSLKKIYSICRTLRLRSSDILPF